MLKLYGGAFSRASIVRWYLEELELPYEFVLLDMQAGEHKQPDFLAINPIGKVPAIADGNFTLWESGAILLYLADKYGKAPLSVEQRALINQWISYANATMGPEVFGEATREKALPRHMTMLNQLLSQQSYVMGDEFGVADVAVGALLGYIPLMLKIDLSEYTAVTDYLQRLAARPAYHKAIGGRS
ncbi:MAG: glutathione S-transferase family protein [Leptolyngbyaceae cyanobacterium bins.349]|nr:glutathione S-transferase family protein [Leptolyngbyaceae cyanobacterium bins.349]